jgi:hypothetical protein
MKPKPLSSLNHLTVPVAMGPPRFSRCCDAEGATEATTCERWHYFVLGPATVTGRRER